MDRKSIPILIVCFILLWALNPLSRKIFPDIPAPAQSTNSVVLAGTGTNGVSTPISIPTLSAATTARPAFSGSAPEDTIVLTNENARYTFTSHGGGIQLVELSRFPRTISKQSRTNPAVGGLVTLNTPVAAPALAIIGDAAVQGDGVFTLTRTATGVHAEKTLPNGLRVIKDFEPGADYLVQTTVRFENTSARELILPVQEWVVGTATPMDVDDKGDTIGVMWYNGSKETQTLRPWFDNKSLMCTTTLPRSEYRAGATNVVWAAAENQYFTLVAMPAIPAEQIVARPLELPRPTEGEASVTNGPLKKGIQTVLVYPAFMLPAGQAAERKITMYAGPKEYKTLSRLANHQQNNLDLIMGFGSIFGFMSKGLLLAMNFIHATLHIQYGWVIIAITVILKLLFWPFTAASMRTAKGMAALQPQMAAIKEKYKDDPLKAQAKTSELWKEHGVHPMNGCLPMLVQIPVFFGLLGMIRTAIELRGAHFLWIADLSKPDTIATIPGLGFLPFGFGIPGVGLPVNILPILYIITALWQTHLTPPSPGMDPAQQRLMRWMPLLFLAILYNYSSGLALYMMVQNLLTILQTKLTKHSIKTPDDLAATATSAPALTHPPKKRK